MGDSIQPILKWAGGKRWLFDERFVSTLPDHQNYIEPFLGGGAGFFSIQPRRAILSDLNPELINVYKVVRDTPLPLQDELRRHQINHCRDYYYSVRAEIPDDHIGRAARTLYLNRTCWNGLYRLNKRGEFNVPIGTKNAVMLSTDDFLATAKLLRNADILCSDFELTIERGVRNDLLFIDPPYTVAHNTNGFVKYNENIFTWNDQIRLRDCVIRASQRGCRILLTNADHPTVRELYKDVGECRSVFRKSVISGKNNGRSSVSELLVTV